MKKIKILILSFILIMILINFKSKERVFQKPIEIKPVEQVQVAKATQNIPIPQEIQEKINEVEKQRIQKKNEEKQRLEQERLKQEELEKEKQKIAKIEQQKQEKKTKVTSRSGTSISNTEKENNWIKFTATAYCNCSKCRRWKWENSNGNYTTGK